MPSHISCCDTVNRQNWRILSCRSNTKSFFLRLSAHSVCIYTELYRPNSAFLKGNGISVLGISRSREWCSAFGIETGAFWKCGTPYSLSLRPFSRNYACAFVNLVCYYSCSDHSLAPQRWHPRGELHRCAARYRTE